MANPVIDNSADSDLKRVILWQYDKAEKLIAIVQMFKDFFNQSTKNIWDRLGQNVGIASFNGTTEVIPATIDEYALALLGKAIGVSRPLLSYTSEGVTTQRMMSAELYRRIIIARWRLANSNASTDAYITFVKYIFGNNVRVDFGEDMSLTFTWTKESGLTEEEVEHQTAITQASDMIFAYPSGVKSVYRTVGPILGFSGQEQSDPDVDDGDFAISNFSGNATFAWPRKAR